jgi:hypothetical protein
MGIIRCKGYLYCTIGSDGWDGQNLGKIIIVDSSSCLCTLDRIFISCLMVLFEEGTAGDPRTILRMFWQEGARDGGWSYLPQPRVLVRNQRDPRPRASHHTATAL